MRFMRDSKENDKQFYGRLAARTDKELLRDALIRGPIFAVLLLLILALAESRQLSLARLGTEFVVDSVVFGCAVYLMGYTERWWAARKLGDKHDR